MASVTPGVWGIDLGQSALKALRLTLVNGEVVATAFDYIEHPKILSQPDADPDALTREALETFLSRNQIRGDTIAISVPGQTGLARFVKLPPVDSKKIPDIVRFEAKQQIPFPLEEVVWDWQPLGNEKAEDFAEVEIGLFAMKRDAVNRYLQSFKDVNVEVHLVQMSPLALCNFVAFDVLGKGGEDGKDEKAGCAVALDIGADNTNLVVTDGEKIIWQRPIPIGGNHFTRALTKEMKLTFAKAEHLKRNATKAEDPKKIFQSMKPVFTDFVGELQRSLGFFNNTHRNAGGMSHIVGLGNAFRLPGLQKYISQTLNQDLDKQGTFHRLRGDEVMNSPVFQENVLSFGVAYGLALQGLGVARLRTNLLPQEIRMERVIRAKKPWAVAAAASLLLGVTVFHGSASSQFATAKAASDQATVAKKNVLDVAAQKQAEFTRKQEALKASRTAAAQILRGGEERTNWSTLQRFINDCLPQPNGDGLPGMVRGTPTPNTASAKYWTEAAYRAYDTKKQRDEVGEQDEIDLPNLIQINLHGIYTRYCDVPMANAFFQYVKTQTLFPEGLGEDYNKGVPPKDPGWAVEVRGFTYHKDGVHFVADTFLANLRTKDKVLSPVDDPSARAIPIKVSHAAIVWQVATTVVGKTPEFKYINRGIYLNEAVKAGTGAGGGPGAPGVSGPGAMMPGAPGTPPPGGPGAAAPGGPGDTGAAGPAPRGDWQGIGWALGAGSEGTGPVGAGGYPGAPEGRGPLAGPVGGVVPGGANPGGGAAPAAKGPQRKVTEFVLFFYWVEPLPTEVQVGVGEGAAPAGGAPTSGATGR